jgi:chemotaxis protein MotB
MIDDERIQPIIIRKKKAAHGGHHGGAWKVAYADFVTAMMALFIVLWIVGQSKQVKEYVSQYFRDPGAFWENTKGGGAMESQMMVGAYHQGTGMSKSEQERLKTAGDSIMAELKKAPDLAELTKRVKIEVMKEGLRIEILESSNECNFDVGTSHLKPEAEKTLGIIADQVAKLPNHVILEGHTDSRQYSRVDGYTNFELSDDRANAARRVLVRSGVGADKIDEVRGCGDSRLHNPKDPLDASNRRIAIIIKFVEGHSVETKAENPPGRR